ncbi:hypothetical protein AAE250_02410 [Bacteroides sp. GD17]|jgi:long-subunit fatty acid transport protein|uniref:hypothetical protein n=1 Tax=Bacteroides sp. GD17 TaxID=3139826 RepID=UPI0025ED52B3|nr:hypothetical protein [uncultured Bacteroides sp.]
MKTLRLLAVLVIAMTASICSAQNGYRGMIEGGRTFHLDETALHATEFSTTHGYQFNPYLFVGAGLGFHFTSSDAEMTYMPLYLDVKANLMQTKVAPFIDVKAGYSVLDAKGVYLSPSVGVNYNFYKCLSVYLKVGYTYQKVDSPIYANSDKEISNIGGITAKIGFEF